ncbi:TDT family transporter [Yinghuangia sp. YIM S10712]|uniref:TDT family transporter n=1 Tax=Yinghuangia sp. YIM S10712 TaxID=3436930 RepID=UPI003F52B27E
MSTGTPRTRLLHELDRPADAFRAVGPNWFAVVMGTGIVATAAVTLPLHVPGLHAVAVLVWLLASALLVAATAATAVQWTRHRDIARGHAANPAMVPFYGAPPMALLAVGAGTIRLGPDVLGGTAALAVGAVLWTLGAATGLACAVAVPYLMITRHRLRLDNVFPTWLLPVVPPMVAAATGPLLIPHLGGHQARLALLAACYAMFGISLLATLALLPLIWARLLLLRTGPPVMAPTLFIVLGPLGQSVSAAHTLGTVAGDAVPDRYAGACEAFALLYGMPVLGFALAWFALAGALVWRAHRQGLPFAMTWWAFTFPVGTCVKGASGLAAQTDSVALGSIAVTLYVLLVAAWAVVATHTARGCLSGRLFRTPAPAAAPGTKPGPEPAPSAPTHATNLSALAPLPAPADAALVPRSA